MSGNQLLLTTQSSATTGLIRSRMVLDVEQAWRTRKIKETLHIAQQGSERPLMNKVNGWYISNIWRDQLL